MGQSFDLRKLWSPRWSYAQLERLADHLAHCLEGGVELRRTLTTIPTSVRRNAAEWPACLELLERGASLAEALEPLRYRFPPFLLPLLACGEMTGNLAEVCRLLADQCRDWRRSEEALRLVWLAPLSIHLGGLLLMTALHLLVGRWSGLTANALALLSTLGTLLAVWVLIWLPPVREILEHLRRHLPFWGILERELAVQSFLHAFAMLYATGGQRVERMVHYAGATVGNGSWRADIRRAAAAIPRGATLVSALELTRLFTPEELSQLAAAETAGRVPETCSRIAAATGNSAKHKLDIIARVAIRIAFGLAVMSLLGTLAMAVL